MTVENKNNTTGIALENIPKQSMVMEDWVSLALLRNAEPKHLLKIYDDHAPTWSTGYPLYPNQWRAAYQRFEDTGWRQAVLLRAAARIENDLGMELGETKVGWLVAHSQTIGLLIDAGAALGPRVASLVTTLYSLDVRNDEDALVKLALMDIAAPISPVDVLASMECYDGMSLCESRMNVIRYAANEDPRFAPGTKRGAALGRWFFERGAQTELDYYFDEERGLTDEGFAQLMRLVTAAHTSRFHRFEALGAFRVELADDQDPRLSRAVREMAEATVAWLDSPDLLAVMPSLFPGKDPGKATFVVNAVSAMEAHLRRTGKAPGWSNVKTSGWGLCLTMRPKWRESETAWDALGLTPVQRLEAAIKMEGACAIHQMSLPELDA